MDAAVSLRRHGALPLAAALPPAPHRHAAQPLQQPPRHSISSSARPPAARLAPVLGAHEAVPAAARSSGRAATGYAAALADACARAGTLRRAFRHARALLRARHNHQQPSSSLSPSDSEEAAATTELDARVAALVRMLVAKGKAAMVAEVMAEFAAICDHLLPKPSRAHASD